MEINELKRVASQVQRGLLVVAYDGGVLYQVDLVNAATTQVGPTGKDVWYTQSMAFDLDTDELYWVQLSSASDHGFYQVNTETGEANPEHPDFDVEVPSDAHYSIDAVDWMWSNGDSNGGLYGDDLFNREDVAYYMILTFTPDEGYCFTEETIVYYNGDASVFDEGFPVALGKFLAKTIDYHVTDPTGIAKRSYR